jgi:hypothetical protein
MKVALSCMIVILVGLLSIPVQALEPFVLYDDFTGRFIDVNKWLGSESKSGSVENLENVRVIITRGYLLMANVAYSDQNLDSDCNVGGTRLYFTEGDLVTAIKARVRVDKVSVTGCPANPIATRARVRLFGFFFNTGVPTPGSAVNDVMAYIGIERRSDSPDAPNILHVLGTVFQCSESPCLHGTTLFSEYFGTVKLREFANLSIQWDQPNHMFIFQLNNNTPIYAPYTVPDTSPPGLSNSKWIEINPTLPNCTAEPRPMAMMGAYFDEVYVNESAGP